jgi:hypothetical protein|tara:strand:+ start:403 stop:729 length:327 start_codon:yes stop_codon:yes gene_type:complete
MAQNFKQIKMREVGATPVDIPDNANFPTGFHTVIGMNMANITANAITVSVYITNTDNYYIIKDMTIPSGSAFTHDSKIVMLAGDRLYFVSDTATSLDVIVSYVENIST